MLRQPIGRIAFEPRHRAGRRVRRMRKRAFAVAMESYLRQHVLRRQILQLSDGDDARQAEIDEPVPEQRARHLRAEAPVPGWLVEDEADLNQRFTLNVIQEMKAKSV